MIHYIKVKNEDPSEAPIKVGNSGWRVTKIRWTPGKFLALVTFTYVGDNYYDMEETAETVFHFDLDKQAFIDRHPHLTRCLEMENDKVADAISAVCQSQISYVRTFK